tara:strand:+ start:671 stop:1543 length:873 start_codon:yes stop_codon:yes gene_type:complete
MKKNTYYFSHDYNAHNDFKILFLRQQLGIEGYGIYWFLIETLANSDGILPLKVIPALSMQMHTTEAKVEAVIKNFELFEISENDFFSIRLNKNLQKLQDLKETNSKKGLKSAELKRLKTLNNSTAVEPQLNHGLTKERKGKEKKENIDNNIFKDTEAINHTKNIESNPTPNVLLENSNLFRKPNVPTFEQVHEDFIRKGGTKEMAEKFFEINSGLDWYYKNSPITNFRHFVSSYISSWKNNDSKKIKTIKNVHTMTGTEKAELYEKQKLEYAQKQKLNESDFEVLNFEDI